MGYCCYYTAPFTITSSTLGDYSAAFADSSAIDTPSMMTSSALGKDSASLSCWLLCWGIMRQDIGNRDGHKKARGERERVMLLMTMNG